jgi:hypothetical protein
LNQDQQAINKEVLRYSGRNLTSSGDKSPLKHFKGHGIDWDVEASPFQNDQSRFVVLKFDRVQVIRLDEGSQPYPYDTAEIRIKHSGTLRSQFGIFMGYFNAACGLQQTESDLDKFVGADWEMEAYPNNWGKIPNSSVADANGDTWSDVWRISLTNGTNPVITPAPVTATVPTQASGETLAFQLLHGKNKSDFIPLVVNNDVLKADAPLFSSIVGDQWIASKIASGEILLNTDQTYTVVSLA